MADINLNVGDMNPEQIKQRFGWATETTLGQVLSTNKVSETALLKIAEHFKIDISELKKLNTSSSANAANSSGIASGITDLNRNTVANHKTMVKATRGLSEGLVKEFMAAKGDQAKGLFDVFSTPLTSFSQKIEFINPKLFTFAKFVGTGIAVIGVVVGRLQEMNDSMRTLYASGARLEVGQLGMLKAATDVGLTLQDFSKILTKYGSVTVGLGTKRLMDLTKQFSIASKMGSEFVMSQSEAQEAFLDTMNLMQNAGILRTMSDRDIVTSSQEYLKQINDLSAATGRSREEIRKNSLAAAQTPATFTALRMLPEAIRDNFNKILTNVTARFGSQGSQLMDEISKYMTGGVGMMSKEFQMMFSQLGAGMGNEMKALAEATKSGDQVSANKALERMGKLLNEMTPAQQRQLMLYGKSNPAFQSLLVKLQQDTQAAYEHQRALEKMTVQERDALRDQETRQKQEQEAFNNAQKAIAGLRNSVDGIIARLGVYVIPALDKFAQGISFVLDKINGFGRVIEKLLTPVIGKDNASVGAGIATIAGGVGIMFILRKVMQAMMSGGARMIASAMGPLLGGAGAAAAGAGGAAAGGMLKGLGMGLAALGNPRALLGVAVLAGIGGSLWIAAKALGAFAELNWETIGKGLATVLGVGILGAVAGAAAPLLIAGSLAIGALGLSLLPFAAAAAIAAPAMEQFGKAVKSSFEGLGSVVESVGKAISYVVDSFTRMRTETVEKTTDQIERLSKLPGGGLITTANGITALKDALEGFSPGILSGFSQFMGSFMSSDPVERLQKLATLGSQLGTAASNIEKFKASIGPLLGQSSSSTTTSTSPGATPVITTDQLSTRTMKYYEESMDRFNAMIDELNSANTTLERIRAEVSENTISVVRAVESSGQRIR